MQACVDWVLIIFETQVIKKKRSVRPVFPDYLSGFYDYGSIYNNYIHRYFFRKVQCNFTCLTSQKMKIRKRMSNTHLKVTIVTF